MTLIDRSINAWWHLRRSENPPTSWCMRNHHIKGSTRSFSSSSISNSHHAVSTCSSSTRHSVLPGPWARRYKLHPFERLGVCVISLYLHIHYREVKSVSPRVRTPGRTSPCSFPLPYWQFLTLGTTPWPKTGSF